ncbi:hypothetical protein HAX54_022638, partial [Datura stramonium]|nr:hypothetical protein [Datura stramonium]
VLNNRRLRPVLFEKTKQEWRVNKVLNPLVYPSIDVQGRLIDHLCSTRKDGLFIEGK